MLQNKSRYLITIISLLGITLALAACNSEGVEMETAVAIAPTAKEAVEAEEAVVIEETSALPDPEVTEIVLVAENGSTIVNHVSLDETLNQMPTGELSDAEAAGLLFMREEEKLAHDVYVTLYDIWGQQTFINISGAEQTHTDAVKTLLARYALQDPAENNGIGIFANADLQALYDQLIVQGSQSLTDAFLVGAAIEEIDILDLEERIAQTDNADIIMVYENLLKGSSNHLRAFVSAMTRQTGEIYHPQYMSQDAYDAIINSATMGQGNKSGHANGANNRNNGSGNRGRGQSNSGN